MGDSTLPYLVHLNGNLRKFLNLIFNYTNESRIGTNKNVYKMWNDFGDVDECWVCVWMAT